MRITACVFSAHINACVCFHTIQQTVPVGVGARGVGASVSRADPYVRLCFDIILKPVHVGVFLIRIGSKYELSKVRQGVAVRILSGIRRIGRVESESLLPIIRHPVTIRIARRAEPIIKQVFDLGLIKYRIMEDDFVEKTVERCEQVRPRSDKERVLVRGEFIDRDDSFQRLAQDSVDIKVHVAAFGFRGHRNVRPFIRLDNRFRALLERRVVCPALLVQEMKIPGSVLDAEFVIPRMVVGGVFARILSDHAVPFDLADRLDPGSDGDGSGDVERLRVRH